MGYEERIIVIYVRVSRHNEDRDRDDDETFDRLQREIQDLIEADPDYRKITDA